MLAVMKNKLGERDGIGGYNSIVYCCNHRFELKGYKDVHNVVVTGNFYITGSSDQTRCHWRI